MRNGFTLIELLIVVAIIGILAAIAIPNFMEAQVRAKVARVKADLATINTGLESYAVDSNHYPPNDGFYNVVPLQLTTPIAYLTAAYLIDPFSSQLRHPIFGDLAKFYTYTRISSWSEFQNALVNGGPLPPIEAIDGASFNVGAITKYGQWRLLSNGPDGSYADPDFIYGSDPLDPNNVLLGADVSYDPTNGTISKGNILRTQKSVGGFIF